MKSVVILLIFDERNRLLVLRKKDGTLEPTHVFETANREESPAVLAETMTGLSAKEHFLTREVEANVETVIYCAHQSDAKIINGVHYSLDELESGDQANKQKLSPTLKKILRSIEPHLAKIPYLELGENEYIYRFRTLKERNTNVYVDQQSATLYQSKLCQAIKNARRIKEKISGDPVTLDFGAVSYIIPSHFGFCLGVQNAIERAYETVAENPGRRVFMLSELIHNSFVNRDLLARGVRFLQTDKGQPYKDDGSISTQPNDPNNLWNQLNSDDIVIIPAFGATNEDKVRLLRKGINIRQNDATCMLVEKVWKAARRYAQEGYTVLIHGKSEHEETKATFSNSFSHGPALMIRNIDHAKQLVQVIRAQGNEKKQLFQSLFKGLYSKGFDPEKDLRKLAVVNQTTLLRNETLKIIEFLHEFTIDHYGEANVADHLWLKGKGDTLCYATQVNQDALQKSLEQTVDAALVVGGKNSSNTFQLYRMCEQRFGRKAHFIQSEANIFSMEKIRHHIFSPKPSKRVGPSEEERPFLANDEQPKRILITGGASCPDGIIQQVIHRINQQFPKESVLPIESVTLQGELGAGS